MKEAEGAAKKGDDTSSAKLKVRFAPGVLSFIPGVWADYRIIDLADDNSYAVVSEPERRGM